MQAEKKHINKSPMVKHIKKSDLLNLCKEKAILTSMQSTK